MLVPAGRHKYEVRRVRASRSNGVLKSPHLFPPGIIKSPSFSHLMHIKMLTEVFLSGSLENPQLKSASIMA